MTKNKLILGENGEDTRLIQGSTIGNTLQKLNKEAYEKRKLALVTEFADDDWRMAWLVTLIEEKLKDRARQGHHELELKFLGEIFPYLGRDENNNDLSDPQFIKDANEALDDEMMITTSLNKRICDLAKRVNLQKNGVSKWTLIDIFKHHHHRNVNSITFKKLNDWLIDEYTVDQFEPDELVEKSEEKDEHKKKI